MKKLQLVFLVCLLFNVFSSYGQSDCSNALPLCTDADSGGVVNGFGVDDFNGSDESGCLKLGLGATTIETNSYWFRIKLAESGEFGFNIIPNDLNEDWDFAVYGPGPNCIALGNPISCNYRGVTGNTGVGLDPTTNTQTDAYEDWMNVNAGEEYVILINQYEGNNAGFSISWQGAVITNNSDPLDCSILVNLGPDRDLCAGQTTVLNATTFGSTYTYNWFIYNNTIGAFEPIVSETAPTLYVTSTGNYKVVVTDTITGEVKEDDIQVTIHEIPIANQVDDIVLCDTNNDGVEDFDLESQTSIITGSQVGMTVTYHNSQVFAQAGAIPQTSPYTSSGATIWARIENAANAACYDITSFQVLAVLSPTAIKPPDLKECDDDNDGFMIFNLDNQTPIIVDNQTGLTVTYYDDETNANDRKGWIVNPATYATITRTIWVRVEPSSGSSCYTITSFEVEVLDAALANQPENIQQCDDNNDGFYQFDFKAMKDAEILGTQSPSTFEINYFATQDDADNNENILPNPYTNVTPYAVETIYARIQNKGSSDCFNSTSFTLQIFDTANPPIPSNIPDLSYCDDNLDSDDTNGFYEFDLTEQNTVILNGQSPLVFDITYFESIDYSVSSQITNPTAFTNTVKDGQPIYVRVTNSNPNNTYCYSDTSFNIEVRPLPNALLTPFEFRQCDEDGTPDGITNFNLAEADTYITLGNTSLNVTYHLSPIDAASGINEQPKYPFSNNPNSTVYARVALENGCYRIVEVNLIVSGTLFPSNYLRQLSECDNDSTNDGIHVFDLSETTAEILTLFFPTQNLRVAFYRNEEDALSETNKINPENAYLNETPYNQIIWVRVESSTDGGCAGIAPVIELTVNPIPEFELDEIDVVCLNDLPLTISTYNAQDTYTYEWTNEAGDIVSPQPTAEIVEAGVYTVVATSTESCESFPKQITITESNIATITPEDVLINDNSNNNSITIITNNLGIGEYEFALNDSAGPYQDSPDFLEVIPGEHTIFVREKNECGIAQVTVYVFGFPNFFTPNGDGENETWNVRGVDSTIFPESMIYIYDRYGKMLANFNATQLGWDGMYNNNKAVSTDYWYLAQMVDLDGNIREYKGHFSLIRR